MKIGETIPQFSLPNQDGNQVDSGTLLQQGPLVLYFYPKDETPGCTAEACAFRDAIEDFRGVDAQVVGISSDSSESHKKFAAKHNLPFTLLSDQGGKLRKQFDVPKSMLGLMPGRVTYVIDGNGVVRHIFDSQLKATAHVREALAGLKSAS